MMGFKDICVTGIKRERCTGCGACDNICPENAIAMRTDSEGFWYPDVDKALCVQCWKCRDVCPVLQADRGDSSERGIKNAGMGRRNIYAAWSKKPEIRYHSTSGGIFSELALDILRDGGYVSGAAYDACHMVRHQVTDKKEDLAKLRQSKYVQSDMGTVYKDIGNLLSQGEALLFCGTPCQCEGVLCYCKEKSIDTEGLYLIDFICRGSNSPKVYRKFLEELEVRYQSKTRRVWFKNKAHGWNCFSTRVDFENGTHYSEDRYHDVYIRGYIEENLYIRPSCSACRFKGFRRAADMTLADFWGVQLPGHMQESDGGTSMVMVHTEKGRELWESISPRLYWTKKELADVMAGNECFYHSVKEGRHREEFMEDLDKMPVIDNIKRFLKNDDSLKNKE